MELEQILLLQGTQIHTTPGNAKQIYDYCLQLGKAGYYSGALKVCRNLVKQENGNLKYAEFYRNLLIRNFINPVTDALFQKYYGISSDDQNRTFGYIIDTIKLIDSNLFITPNSADLYAKRGKLLFMLSETVAADWDIQQCIRFDGDYYNLARTKFYENNLKDCWANLNRYSQVVEKRKIPYLKEFLVIKNMVSQLLVIDTLLNKGDEKVPLFLKRAEIYLQAERFKQSILDLDAVIAMEPSNFRAYAMRAYAQKKSGNDSSAMSDLSEAERLSGGQIPDLDKLIK
jgi:tetratricopeptide (TPR) repeat protein